MNRVLLLLSIALMPFGLSAQQRVFKHNAGAQINLLLKQVLNLNNSSTNTAVDNPYIFMYTLTHSKTNIGLRLGVGYDHRSFAENDGISKVNTDRTNIDARIGIEKAFVISKKWTTGVGVDAVLHNNKNNTDAETKSFDTTTTITNAQTKSIGFGPVVWLRYNISERVQIGTEGSFYYLFGTQKEDVTVKTRGQSVPGNLLLNTRTIAEQDFSEAITRAPVAFYIIINF